MCRTDDSVGPCVGVAVTDIKLRGQQEIEDRRNYQQRIAALEAANRTATAEIETLQFEVGRLGGQNAKLKAAALAVAKEPWGSTSEAHHFERMAKMDALRKMLGVNPHV
mgnify:CR=1 FL=1